MSDCRREGGERELLLGLTRSDITNGSRSNAVFLCTTYSLLVQQNAGNQKHKEFREGRRVDTPLPHLFFFLFYS